MSKQSPALKRVMMDLKVMKKNPAEGISVEFQESNALKLIAEVCGLKDSLFEGGKFIVQLIFTEDYPFKPPKIVKFLTPIFHPNVYQQSEGSDRLSDGKICLGKMLGDDWKPSYGVSTILLAIQGLLDDPNVDDPANETASTLFKKHLKNTREKSKSRLWIVSCGAVKIEIFI